MNDVVHLNKVVQLFETPPLETFIGSGFDLEEKSISWQVVNRHNRAGFEKHQDLVQALFNTKHKLRPRINHRTSVNKYTFLEYLPQFVWDCMIIVPAKNEPSRHAGMTTECLLTLLRVNCDVVYLGLVSVLKGSRYERWARKNEIPIVDNV